MGPVLAAAPAQFHLTVLHIRGRVVVEQQLRAQLLQRQALRQAVLVAEQGAGLMPATQILADTTAAHAIVKHWELRQHHQPGHRR